ncbi:MAG: thiamine-monophosphate kinase [Rhodospirillaceae bacterium]|nr:MAG: thiamine-monophosphate kinase [Rhodospirillaceae bacterium]
MARRGEFELIETLFAPLAEGFPGALGLKDDAALLDPPAGRSVVVTADALVAGVHFRPADPPDLIARKLVRVNLSDLAAMGAEPWAMVLTAAFPDSVDESWITRFAEGLGADGRSFGLPLIGGDTVATPGPATFSLTAFGLVEQGLALRRSGARPGDGLYVTGTLGDGALGMGVLTGRLALTPEESAAVAYLVERYHVPRPRLAVGRGLVGLAHACVDVSDGLLQDLAHLCRCSGVGAEVWAERLPVSPAAARLATTRALRGEGAWLETILSGGDDYELLFSAPPGMEKALARLAVAADTAITAVGTVVAGDSVVVMNREGMIVPFSRWGYQHFGPGE